MVSAQDQTTFGMQLEEWLRKKGFAARCIEKYDFIDKPYKWFYETMHFASNVIVICSPQYMEIVSGGCTDKDMDGKYWVYMILKLIYFHFLYIACMFIGFSTFYITETSPSKLWRFESKANFFSNITTD